MKRFAVAVSIAGLLGASLEARAASAPAQLHNKTVIMTWSTSGTGTSAAGEQRSYSNINTRSVYVSSAGRPFLRMELRAASKRGMGRSGDFAPGEGGGRRGVSFDGNRLIGSESFASGARQYIATFDASFSSCTLAVIDGRSGGAAIQRRGPDSAMYTLGPVTTGSPSCSVQNGNVFAGQQ